MGLLMRGTVENFNPQIHTESTSLTYLMNKHNAIRRKSIDLHARYTKFQSWMFASGRYNNGAAKGRLKGAASQELHDNAYRVQYEGALILPAYSMGAVHIGEYFDGANPAPDMSGITGVDYANGLAEATVTVNTPASIAIKHDPANEIYGDKFGPNDTIVLDPGGANVYFIIQQIPRRASDSSHYILDGIFQCAAGQFDEDFVEDGMVFTEGGDFFGEGSLRGSQRYRRNKWRINYTSIHRSTVTFTGSAKKQKVVNIFNSDAPGQKSWEYQLVLDNDMIGEIKDELALRYSRSSMDVTGHAWFENYGTNTISNSGFRVESGLEAPIMGEGWIPAITDNFRFDYDVNTGLSIEMGEAILMVLSQRSPHGTSGNTFVFVTDKLGHMAVDKMLKKVIGFGNPAANTAAGVATSNIFDVRNGKENKIGFTVTTYEYLANTFVVIEDEILNNPDRKSVV